MPLKLISTIVFIFISVCSVSAKNSVVSDFPEINQPSQYSAYSVLDLASPSNYIPLQAQSQTVFSQNQNFQSELSIVGDSTLHVVLIIPPILIPSHSFRICQTSDNICCQRFGGSTEQPQTSVVAVVVSTVIIILFLIVLVFLGVGYWRYKAMNKSEVKPQ